MLISVGQDVNTGSSDAEPNFNISSKKLNKDGLKRHNYTQGH